ncbi:hypothetical protein EYF80_062304 [Liparis tanakae]|uniref:Uncharacterized protein n=1 Tax=Liparis tanakae TaxID=230148 RepID=A0A4Z2EFY0_9TELE|nr:hypothetical protein EYF80_062304 [Liparis tanakae]
MREDEAPAAAHREQDLQDDAGRSGHPLHQVVRGGGRLQRDGDGAAGAQPGGPVQLLLPEVQPQDGAAAGRPDDQPHRIHPLEELHPPRREARQLPDGPRQEGQPGLHHRLRPRQEIPRRPNAPAHPVPREQEPDGHGALRLHQHAPGHRAVQTGRPGVAGLRAHVLQPGLAALAGPQGRHQEAEVRAHQREEDVHAHRGALQRIPV